MLLDFDNLLFANNPNRRNTLCLRPDTIALTRIMLRCYPLLLPLFEHKLMLEDAFTSGTNKDALVTAIISHVVRPGREQGYEEWFHGIAADARKFKGHLGVTTIRPNDDAQPEYVVILKFDCYDNLKTWLESDVRRQWIERLQPLIAKSESIQPLTGLETWFTLPKPPTKTPPPRYKMALVTWLGVFVTLAVLSRLAAPILSGLPILLNQLITTGLVVTFLTYVLMPPLTKLFKGWLYPVSKL